jgi:hypothetical protein
MKRSELVAAAKELNEVLDPDPKINVKGTPEELEAGIREASEILAEDDKLTKATRAVLDAVLASGKSEASDDGPEDDKEEAEAEAETEADEKPAKAKKATKPAKPAKSVKTDKGKSEPKGSGVISTIVSAIEKSGKKGISKDDLLVLLKKTFKDRDESSMKNTINIQVPARISKERFAVDRMENGNYRKR